MKMLDKITEETKLAMKAKDKVRVLTLRTIVSEARNKAILDKRKDVTDEDILSSINKNIKQRLDSIEQFNSANRQDLVDTEQAELEILKEFQPKQMSEEDIIALVDKVIVETSASTKKDLGNVMGKLMPQVKGKADGKLVSKIVNDKLS